MYATSSLPPHEFARCHEGTTAATIASSGRFFRQRPAKHSQGSPRCSSPAITTSLCSSLQQLPPPVRIVPSTRKIFPWATTSILNHCPNEVPIRTQSGLLAGKAFEPASAAHLLSQPQSTTRTLLLPEDQPTQSTTSQTSCGSAKTSSEIFGRKRK